jgi:hypothetical protein
VPLEDQISDAIVLVAETRGEGDSAGTRIALADAVRATVGFAPHAVILTPPGAIPLTANGKIRHLELVRLIKAGQAPFDAGIAR